MGTTPGGLPFPDGSDEFDPSGDMQAGFDAADVGRIIPVANTTDRTALASALSPSSSKPLYVHREDANAGARIEVTEDGSEWNIVPSATPWQTITPATGWAVGGGGFTPPQWRRIGAEVEIMPGRMNRFSAGGGSNLTVVAATSYALSTASLPVPLSVGGSSVASAAVGILGTAGLVSSYGSAAVFDISSTGVLQVISGVSGTVTATDAGSLGAMTFVPYMRYRVA